MSTRTMESHDRVKIVDVRSTYANIEITAGDGPTVPKVKGPRSMIGLVHCNALPVKKGVTLIVSNVEKPVGDAVEHTVTKKAPFRSAPPMAGVTITMTVEPGTIVQS